MLVLKITTRIQGMKIVMVTMGHKKFAKLNYAEGNN
jgi:hypothetical protein